MVDIFRNLIYDIIREMVVMKKVLIGVFFCVLGVFIFSLIKVKSINNDNITLQNEINKINTDSNSLELDNQNKETEIENLKVEQKDKLEEVEIWEKAEEKLKSALS